MGARLAVRIAAMLALASPALAQTDDRIANDAMQLLAADAVVTEIGTLCIADTGNDPAMVAAVERWRARNQSWRIVGVTTLGTRGVAYDASSLEYAQTQLRDTMMPNYTAAADKPSWCLRMAGDIEAGQLDAGKMFPEAATRIEEAKRGKWPVLDVANSHEVYQATEVLDWFDYNQQFMARCGSVFGDSRRLYADAFPYWAQRNGEHWINADKIMTAWGALDPQRMEAIRAENAKELDDMFSIDFIARSMCEDFVATIEEGPDDIVSIDPYVAEEVARLADEDPYESVAEDGVTP
jgi:hypothetical protein